MQITQLCYASKRVETDYTLIDDIREILVKSREYNLKNNICGVLYYAHGYYFQCIQGEFKDIMRLYEKIIKDNRHANIKLIQHKSVKTKTFAQWSMKYVQKNTQLDTFFTESGVQCFQPLNIKDNIVDKFLDIILSDSEIKPPKLNQGFMLRGYSGYF